MAESEEVGIEAEAESSEEEQAAVEETETSTDAAEHLEEAEAEAESEGEVEIPEPEAEVEPDPAPSEEEPVHKPFSFTVDGRRIEVEGASLVEHADTEGNQTQSIVVPLEVFRGKMLPHMADRGAFAREKADFKRQIDDLDPANNETVIRAQTLLDAFENEVLASEESLTAFLENFDKNKELLGLRADKAATTARTKVRDERDSADQSERSNTEAVGQIEQDLPVAVRQIADALGEQLGASVHDRALEAAADEIADNLGMYYRYATQTDADQYGVEVGEIVRDDDRVARTINRFNALMSAGSEQQTKTDEARKKNQAALTKKEPPPTITESGSSATPEKVVEIKSKEEFRERMGLNT